MSCSATSKTDSDICVDWLVSCFLARNYYYKSPGLHPWQLACTISRLSISCEIVFVLHDVFTHSLLILVATLSQVRFLLAEYIPILVVILCSARSPQILKNSHERSCEGDHNIRLAIKSLSSLIVGAGLSILFLCCQSWGISRTLQLLLTSVSHMICHQTWNHIRRFTVLSSIKAWRRRALLTRDPFSYGGSVR